MKKCRVYHSKSYHERGHEDEVGLLQTQWRPPKHCNHAKHDIIPTKDRQANPIKGEIQLPQSTIDEDKANDTEEKGCNDA